MTISLFSQRSRHSEDADYFRSELPGGHVRQQETSQEEIELVRNTFLLPGPAAARVVIFSSVESSCGCGRICSRAGEALAGLVHESVCVVDANFRSPSLHDYFEVSNLKGLTEAVFQSGPIKQFAQRVRGDNLWLLSCGFHQVDPERFLSSQSLSARIGELRVAFDHVLIAAAPAILFSDAALLGRLSDGLVLVIEANSTRKEPALKAKESLEAAGVKLLGAVLNNRTFPIPEAIYKRL
jgi:Mrp family chromosome partitioning ATPase